VILLQFDDFQCLLQIKREKEDKKGRCQPIKAGRAAQGIPYRKTCPAITTGQGVKVKI
jgi:hypothetical protein